MTRRKKISVNEDPEYGIDSRYQSTEEKEHDSIALMEARLERIKKLPKEQILRAKLLQLQLRMEAYLKEPVYDDQNHFTHFLKTYVDTVYEKRSEFAMDMNVTPVFLSKIINSHREPNEEFILKLMIHSGKVFKKVGVFNEETWYQVYLHEKLCDTMANQRIWRPKIEKQVKLANAISK